MQREELFGDIVVAVVLMVIFGTIFSVTRAYQDEPQPSKVVFLSAPAHTNTSERTVPMQNVAALRSAVKLEEVQQEVPQEEETPETVTKPEPETEDISTPKTPTISENTPTEQPAPKKDAGQSTYIQELAALIESKTNAFRKKNNLSVLSPDSVLEQNALAFSTQMLREDFFSHSDSNGCDFTCRFNASGYDARTWGENLAQFSFSSRPSAESVADEFMRGWQKSAGHKENLLSPAFTHQGIGVAMDDEIIYVTVDFAQPAH